MKNIFGLGKGRLSGACKVGDASVILIRRRGALVRKRLIGKKIIGDGIVSYARDRYDFPIGILTMDEEVKFENADQSE